MAAAGFTKCGLWTSPCATPVDSSMPGSFLTIFAELEAAVADGALTRYAVGGAIAVTFYLEATETEDVDVFVVADDHGSLLNPFGAVYQWFRERGAGWQDEHLVVAGWPLHLLPSTGPLVDDGLRHARRETVEGQPVCVLSLEHLAAIALETGRGKDRLRLLQMWESSLLDRERFLALVERFGLTDRWQRFLLLIEDST